MIAASHHNLLVDIGVTSSMDRYYRPSSVSEASQYLAETDGAELIAGGQTMTLHLRQGLKSPSTLVDIGELDELSGVTRDDETVTIGSATTYATLEQSDILAEAFPYFVEALGHVAGPQVRHNGTIGGGLCYADPALDTPPVLLTLDATVVCESVDANRSIPLTDFYTGYYETALEDHEILTEIRIPTLPPRSAGTYLTMAPRQGDYAIAGVAIRLTLSDEGVCEHARIALTNGGDVPMRTPSAEDALTGTTLESDAIDEAVMNVRDALDILEDVQTPKSYRETIFQRLTQHGIRELKTTLETQ